VRIDPGEFSAFCKDFIVDDCLTRSSKEKR